MLQPIPTFNNIANGISGYYILTEPTTTELEDLGQVVGIKLTGSLAPDLSFVTICDVEGDLFCPNTEIIYKGTVVYRDSTDYEAPHYIIKWLRKSSNIDLKTAAIAVNKLGHPRQITWQGKPLE